MDVLRVVIRLAFILAIPALVGFATYRGMMKVFAEPLKPGSKEERAILVTPETTFKQLCGELEKQGIVRYAWSVEILSRLRKGNGQIKVGEYSLSPGLTPKQVLERLFGGKVLRRTITLNAGSSIWELGDAVAASGLLSKEEFEQSLTNQTLLVQAGIQAKSFEGYLFPGPYTFSRPVTAKQIIFTMIQEGEKHWPDTYTERVYELGLSRPQILTLASIIEKESSGVESMPTISSVLHNRLNQGMKLEADATVLYGLEDRDRPLSPLDRQKDHPFNTYLHFGLPQGPICNPGKEAIRAALYPDETEYLFYLRDPDGGHIFSTTRAEHDAALLREMKLEP